jgi:hypothetical protein
MWTDTAIAVTEHEAGPGLLGVDLPAALQAPTRLRGALRGDDVDALERLEEVLTRHEERRLLAMARGERDVCWTDDHEAEPLVTIRIATYHRPEHIGAAIESCLAQTYPRLEVLVVGIVAARPQPTSCAASGIRDCVS